MVTEALVLNLSGGGVFSLGNGKLSGNLFGGPQNAADDIRHSATSVGIQDLDSDKVDSLGNAVLAWTDGTGAVSSDRSCPRQCHSEGWSCPRRRDPGTRRGEY